MPSIINSDDGVVSGSSGLKTTGGNDGILALQNNGTTNVTVTAAGNVGIGTSSPAYKLDVLGSVSAGQVVAGIRNLSNTANSDAKLYIEAYSNSRFSYTQYGVNGVGSWNTGYDVASGSYRISNDGGGSLNTNTRMVIDSSGNFMVGTTSPTARFTVAESGNAPAGDFYTSGGAVGTPCMYVKKQPNNSSTSQVYIQFLFNNGSSGNGQINGNGSGAAAFGSYSDARLKENIVDLPPQLENICALRPVEFDYIESEGGGHQTGFIAQEMQQVYPDAVGMREPDEMLTVTGWSKTEARLVKAIQEQQQMIETLQAEVAELKARA